MANIEYNGTILCKTAVSLLIIPKSDISCQKDIDRIKQLIKKGTTILRLTATKTFTITQSLFDDYSDITIISLYNVILGKDAANSICSNIKTINVDCEQPHLNELDIPSLTFFTRNEHFTIPSKVKELTAHYFKSSPSNLTINCNDNLEKVEIFLRDTIVTLTNCNNLKQVILNGANSWVYGEFTNYIGYISVRNCTEGVCQYLSLFKNLREYNGPVTKDILKILDGIKKIVYSTVVVNVTIEDIPDSLEDMNFWIKDIDCSDILDRKPNIRRIYHNGTKLEPRELIQKYPNVYFYRNRTIKDMNIIELNNKKLISLIDLC